MSKITIKDIAKESNVSITAVSFVLNGKNGSVSEETNNKILEVCKKHNYHPNYIAASLKRKQSYTVGCIVPSINNDYYSRLLSTLSNLFREKGYSLFISDVGYQIKEVINKCNEMINRSVDYLVIIPPSTLIKEKNQFKDLIHNIDVPFVMLDRKSGLDDCNEVYTDDLKGGYLLTKYLLERGHKNIAIITGPNFVSSSEGRLQGYKKALKEKNIPFDEKNVFVGDYQFESGLKFGEKIILEKKCDAIFACNDLMAYGVYKAAANNNIKIGKDISIVGYDDNLFSSLITPGLTTVRQNIDEICLEVVNQLFSKDNKKVTHIIEPILVERESVK